MDKIEYKQILQSDVDEKLFADIMKVESARDTGYSEDAMRMLWQTSGINVNFVCTLNDRIIGHISFNPNSKRRNGSIYMVNLTIDPAFVRRGFAQNLILESCKYFINQGETKLMSLHVDKDNQPAVNLYHKVGFENREPICEADEDDEQFIMDNNLQTIKYTIENLNKGTKNEKF